MEHLKYSDIILVLFVLRRSRPEKEMIEVLPQENAGDGIPSKPSLPGLLEVDTGLWTHIYHTQSNVQPLASPTQQVEQLAK